jgi:hypothetical protein
MSLGYIAGCALAAGMGALIWFRVVPHLKKDRFGGSWDAFLEAVGVANVLLVIVIYLWKLAIT